VIKSYKKLPYKVLEDANV